MGSGETFRGALRYPKNHAALRRCERRVPRGIEGQTEIAQHFAYPDYRAHLRHALVRLLAKLKQTWFARVLRTAPDPKATCPTHILLRDTFDREYPQLSVFVANLSGFQIGRGAIRG